MLSAVSGLSSFLSHVRFSAKSVVCRGYRKVSSCIDTLDLLHQDLYSLRLLGAFRVFTKSTAVLLRASLTIFYPADSPRGRLDMSSSFQRADEDSVTCVESYLDVTRSLSFRYRQKKTGWKFTVN